MQTYLRLGHDSVLYDPFRNDAIIFGGLSAYPYLRRLPHANYLAYCPVSCRETRVQKRRHKTLPRAITVPLLRVFGACKARFNTFLP